MNLISNGHQPKIGIQLLDEFPGNGKDTNFMKNERQKRLIILYNSLENHRWINIVLVIL